MLGQTLDHHAWNDAAIIFTALGRYWATRGLGGEAAGWTDRIQAAIADSGQPPTPPAQSLWMRTIDYQAALQQIAGHLDQAAQAYQRTSPGCRNSLKPRRPEARSLSYTTSSASLRRTGAAG
jgi:hypothetical protein